MDTKADKQIIDKLRRFGRKLKNHLSKSHGGLDSSEMTKLGFKYFRKRSSSGGIYVNKEKGLVVKENYITEDLTKQEMKYIVPTIFLDHIAIQPLCTPFRNAQKKHEETRRIEDHVSADVHPGNVMLYNKKAVLIDW
jgi:hypothetical protein